VDNSAAAELKTTLQGVTLPAEKPALLEYAVQQRAEPSMLDALQSLPEREFESLDEVVEELVRGQPPSLDGAAAQPKEESGAPPGGDEYTSPDPSDTGQVRDLDKVEE
jgi:hypothetical protein